MVCIVSSDRCQGSRDIGLKTSSISPHKRSACLLKIRQPLQFVDEIIEDLGRVQVIGRLAGRKRRREVTWSGYRLMKNLWLRRIFAKWRTITLCTVIFLLVFRNKNGAIIFADDPLRAKWRTRKELVFFITYRNYS
jgi:hypothetical protein